MVVFGIQKRGMGGQKVKKTQNSYYGLYLPKEVRDRLQEQAEIEHRSLSNFIQKICLDKIAEYNKNELTSS